MWMYYVQFKDVTVMVPANTVDCMHAHCNQVRNQYVLFDNFIDYEKSSSAFFFADKPIVVKRSSSKCQIYFVGVSPCWSDHVTSYVDRLRYLEHFYSYPFMPSVARSGVLSLTWSTVRSL
jgi:hypothetical protein